MIIMIKQISSNKNDKRRITFKDQPTYYSISAISQKTIYNENDKCRKSIMKLVGVKAAETSSEETNGNYSRKMEIKNKISYNNYEKSMASQKHPCEEDKNGENQDISTEIMSDKIVQSMMSTGDVTDKYTPAVRAIQEGKYLRINIKNILGSYNKC